MEPSCGSTALSGAVRVVVLAASGLAVAVGVTAVDVTAGVRLAGGAVLVAMRVTVAISVGEAVGGGGGWASRVAVPATAVSGWAARAVAVASAAAIVAMAAVWV